MYLGSIDMSVFSHFSLLTSHLNLDGEYIAQCKYDFLKKLGLIVNTRIHQKAFLL
jgi:hypothetical protein